MKPWLAAIFMVLIAAPYVRAQQPATAPATTAASTQPWQQVGTIEAREINESSGIIESRKRPGVFFTHNDSGNPAEIYAITREGKLVARFPVRAPNVDWEDIAADDQGHLFIADTGNNNHDRPTVQVYRIPEPDPAQPAAGAALTPDLTLQLRWPDVAHDAEALFILKDHGYIVTKHRDLTRAQVFRFSLTPRQSPQVLEKVLDLPTTFPVTAADVSRDGKYMAIMSVLGPSIYEIDGDVANARRGAIWTAPFADVSVEAVTFVSGGILATTEGRRIIFFPFRPAPAASRPIIP